MQLTKTVMMEQAKWEAVEREVQGFNSSTRESGIFRTAAEHGCRRINCTQHWRMIPLPPKRVTVVVSFDEDEVAQELAIHAARNGSGRAIEFGGLLKAKVVR